MSLLSQTRSAFALLFLTLLLVGSAWNIYSQLPRFSQNLAAVSFKNIRKAGSELKKLAEEHFIGKYAAWEAHAAIQEALGKTEVNDFTVVKAENGRLYQGGLYPIKIDNARILAGVIADFTEAAEEKGMRVLYLNPPDSVLKNAPPQPSDLPYRDYNIASDALLYTLRERGVPCLDARYSFIESGFPPAAISHPTSLQLSGEAGFALFSYLVASFERQFSLSLDPNHFYRNPDNYIWEAHRAFFIGELGKRSGPAFSGLDDYTTITPAFETDFVYEATDMFENVINTEGEAEETLLNPDALVYYDNLYLFYPQSYYRLTNTVSSRISNQRRHDGPRLLIVHDYYTAEVITLLAPLFAGIHTLAYQENFSVNVLDYIEENYFDYVLIAFSPENLVNPRVQTLIGQTPE